MSESREQLEARLSAYLDDELTPQERAEVERLLAAHPQSRELLADLRVMTRTLQGMPRMRASADLMEGIRARMERRELLGGPPAARQPVAGMPVAARWAAAAAIAIMTSVGGYALWNRTTSHDAVTVPPPLASLDGRSAEPAAPTVAGSRIRSLERPDEGNGEPARQMSERLSTTPPALGDKADSGELAGTSLKAEPPGLRGGGPAQPSALADRTGGRTADPGTAGKPSGGSGGGAAEPAVTRGVGMLNETASGRGYGVAKAADEQAPLADGAAMGNDLATPPRAAGESQPLVIACGDAASRQAVLRRIEAAAIRVEPLYRFRQAAKSAEGAPRRPASAPQTKDFAWPEGGYSRLEEAQRAGDTSYGYQISPQAGTTFGRPSAHYSLTEPKAKTQQVADVLVVVPDEQARQRIIEQFAGETKEGRQNLGFRGVPAKVAAPETDRLSFDLKLDGTERLRKGTTTSPEGEPACAHPATPAVAAPSAGVSAGPPVAAMVPQTARARQSELAAGRSTRGESLTWNAVVTSSPSPSDLDGDEAARDSYVPSGQVQFDCFDAPLRFGDAVVTTQPSTSPASAASRPASRPADAGPYLLRLHFEISR
jgi:anti-sigma factor RsiW